MLVVLTLVSVLFPVVLFPLHGIGDIKLLDLYFSYNADQVYNHLAALGAEGRSSYARMALTSDLAFPVSYSLTLSIALMLVLRKLFPSVSRFRYLCLFPFLIVIIDWCENLSLAFVTRAFPVRTDAIISSASFFTSLKWSLVVLTVLLLLATAAFWAVVVVRNREKGTL